MEVRLVNTTSTARDDGPARCLIAIELSKSSWVVGVQTPLSNKTSQYRLAGGDWEGLLKLIERIRRQVGRELSRPVEMISCYEAGYDGFWLHRLLTAAGVHNHVLDPASLLVNRRARRAKTDRIDVERMLRALSRYLRGEPDACSVVRVPSVEQEDARRLHRERHRLIQERVQHVNRIKGLCPAAGGKADDDAHRPCRIGLRPSERRHRRERGSARCQMQKLSALEFHGGAPDTVMSY
jgi:transposase